MKQNPGGTNLRFSMLHDQISQSWPTEEWRERAQVWFSSQVMAPTWMDRKLRRWKSSVGHWDTHTSGKLSKHITLREKPDAEHSIKSSLKNKAKHSQSKASYRTARGTNEINELGGETHHPTDIELKIEKFDLQTRIKWPISTAALSFNVFVNVEVNRGKHLYM